LRSSFAFGIVIIGLLFSGTSCSPVYYTPTVAISPGLEEKDDMILMGSMIASGSGGLNLELSYSPLNNIGVLLRKTELYKEYTSFNTNTTTGVIIRENRRIKHSNFDVGVGWYKYFFEAIHLNAYATGGRGFFKDDIFRGSFLKIGIHPSIIFDFNRFDVGLHSSFLKLNYSNLHYDFNFREESQFAYLTANNKHSIREFFLSSRFKVNRSFLDFQIGFSDNLSNPSFRQDKVSVSIGLVLDLDKLFRKGLLKNK